MRPFRSMRSLASFLGATCAVTQVIALREMASTLRLEALSYGLVLAAWLAFFALGTFLGRRVRPRFERLRFMWLFLGFLLLAFLPFHRAMRSFLPTAEGESLGLGAVLLFASFGLAPLVLVMGGLFALLLALEGEGPSGQVSRRIYRWEVAGFAVGAILHRIALANGVEALPVLVVLVFWLLALWFRRVATGPWKRFLAIALAVLGTWLAFFPWRGSFRGMEGVMHQWRWGGERVLSTLSSSQGDLVATNRAGQISLWLDGRLVSSVPDLEFAELFADLAAGSLDRPRRILLLGGVASGLLRELLRHPVDQVDLCVDDLAALAFLERIPGADGALGTRDDRVRVHEGDPRRLLEGRGPWDLILLAEGDPGSVSSNRHYTLSFFRALRPKLADGGRLVLALSYSPRYSGRRMRALNVAVFKALEAAFPELRLLVGDPMIYMAGEAGGMRSLDGAAVQRRLGERGIEPRTLFPAVLAERFSRGRLADALDQEEGGRELLLDDETRLRRGKARWREDELPPNDVSTPVSYRLSLELWLQMLDPRFASLYAGSTRIPLWIFCIVPFLLALGLRRRGRAGSVIAFSVMGTGFTGMGIELAVIYLYEALRGHVLQELALVAALFMFGLLLGSRDPGLSSSEASSIRRLRLHDLVMACLAAFLPLWAKAWPMGGWGFLFALVVSVLGAGFFVGARFGMAVDFLLARTDGQERELGARIYAYDLMGGVLGSLVLLLYFLPVHGFAGLAAILVATKAGNALALTGKVQE